MTRYSALWHRLANWYGQLDRLSRLRLVILVGLFCGGVISLLPVLLIQGQWTDMLLNIGTELIGSSITFFLVDQILGRYEQREAMKQAEEFSRTELIARLGSSVQSFAVAAAEELRRRGWLTDESLTGVSLLGANLQGAPLSYAQLAKANLADANLQQADLSRVNLANAHLDGASLQHAYMPAARLDGASLVSAKLGGADLREAHLQQAELIMADLQHANLRQAVLCGAYLSAANLQGASLQQADLRDVYGRGADLRGADLRGASVSGAMLHESLFDAHTLLPDGTAWSPDTPIRRLTHPNEPLQSQKQQPQPADDLLDSLLS
jgi:hypothetical protein